jgi:hypothetical protein
MVILVDCDGLGAEIVWAPRHRVGWIAYPMAGFVLRVFMGLLLETGAFRSATALEILWRGMRR